MTAPSLPERFDVFLDAFYRPPNELTLAIRHLSPYIAAGRAAVTAHPATPFVMPAKVGGITHYFAIAFTARQARTLRELLRSYVGTTWTDFDGNHLQAGGLDPLERAAVGLTGQTHTVFRFQVFDHETARTQVRSAIEALSVSLATTRAREARIDTPVGRLLGNFNDACAATAEQTAEEAYKRLDGDHRVSSVNKVFLRVQLLAAFGRWDEIKEGPEFVDLLRMPRPALASDALAHVAMSAIGDDATLQEAGDVATEFGALIPSVSAIRSEDGARYYGLWALRAGELPATVRERLTAAGWPGDAAVGRWFQQTAPEPDRPSPPSANNEVRAEVRSCLETGRYDNAVELLAGLALTADDLPAALEAVVNTWTPGAVALLESCRARFGEQALRTAAPRVQLPSSADLGLSVTGHLTAVFHRGTSAPARERHLKAIEKAGVGALRIDGEASAIADAIRQTTGLPDDEVDPERGLDACLDMARDLKASGDVRAELRALGLAVVELWALRDRSGDRDRVRRVCQLVNDVVELGLSVDVFDELVEWLRLGWEPFDTESDLPLSLELLELLLVYRPAQAHGLDVFGRQILSRLGPHNARRLPLAALDVAANLAPAFGLELSFPVEEQSAPPAPTKPATVLLYSLLEPMLARSAAILRARHPELTIRVCHDHVATEGLRSAAKGADVIVIMDRAATHAATEALRAIKGVPIRYAPGKGSTSMIEEVEAWMAERSAGDEDHDD